MAKELLMAFWTQEQKHNTGLGIQLRVQFDEHSKALGRPRWVETQLNSVDEKVEEPLNPMPYHTDALVGLSAYKLLVHSKEALSSNEEALAALLWQRLEPMHEVYHRSLQRIKHLLSSHSTNPNSELVFEQGLRETIRAACSPRGTDLHALLGLLETFQQVEAQRGHPLLFDTKIQLSASTLSVLHTVYSFLYNLRAITAAHYNSVRIEPLYEALQLNSIKDYFHAPDLLTNDALLYHHMLSLRDQGKLSTGSEDSLAEAFLTYLPHSHFLVNALPETFFTGKESETLENDLYRFQIDWLLGSPAGLLYRIREELIGVRDGYENTFWPELQNEEAFEPFDLLQLRCVLGADYIKDLSSAA